MVLVQTKSDMRDGAGDKAVSTAEGQVGFVHMTM